MWLLVDEKCSLGICRNSDRLGNGVLYASVNPEYLSATEGEYWLMEKIEIDLNGILHHMAKSMWKPGPPAPQASLTNISAQPHLCSCG